MAAFSILLAILLCPPDALDSARGEIVGKVDCLQIDGLELWFNSNDHHPHHFHVMRKGAWEARIRFLEVTADTLTFDIIRGQGPSRAEREELRRLVVQHREALLREWERKVCPR